MRNSNKTNLTFSDLYLNSLIAINMKSTTLQIFTKSKKISEKNEKLSKIYPMNVKYANTMR